MSGKKGKISTGAALTGAAILFYLMRGKLSLASFAGAASSQSKRSAFIVQMSKLIGVAYVWGGEDPSLGGVDCSGAVQYAYKRIGIPVPRLVTEQASQAPFAKMYDSPYKSVAEVLPSLQAGDCLGLDYAVGGRFDHVIVYVGNGYFVHASGGEACPDKPGSRCRVVKDPASHFGGANVRAVYSWA